MFTHTQQMKEASSCMSDLLRAFGAFFFCFYFLVFSGSPSSNQMDFVQIPFNIKKGFIFGFVGYFFRTRFQWDLDMTNIISVKNIYDKTFSQT